MPRAFFGTFFRFERKYFPPRGGSPTTRAVVGASIPHRGKGDCACGRPKGFPRGKQSARFALPCAPLVVCLNSGSLTAFGGCIHWIPASLRSPLETFGRQSRRRTHGSCIPCTHGKMAAYHRRPEAFLGANNRRAVRSAFWLPELRVISAFGSCIP